MPSPNTLDPSRQIALADSIEHAGQSDHLELAKMTCGHDVKNSEPKKHRQICRVCGSFADRDFSNKAFEYRDDYGELRNHFDPNIGALKVRTMLGWFKKLNLHVQPLHVCEVGFGGGYCLAHLNQSTKITSGIEITEATLQHGSKLGVPRERLFSFKALPDATNPPVDLWLFQDSFEHLDSPQNFVSWLKQCSMKDAKVLIVAPRADSLSQRAMGVHWPHRLPDHSFHWSKRGLIEFFHSAGFRLEKSFYPLKWVSLEMIAAHFENKWDLKAGLSRFLKKYPFLAFPFNFGEMGLLFVRISP